MTCCMYKCGNQFIWVKSHMLTDFFMFSLKSRGAGTWIGFNSPSYESSCGLNDIPLAHSFSLFWMGRISVYHL